MSKSGPLSELGKAIGKLATGKLKPLAGADAKAGGSDGASVADAAPKPRAGGDAKIVGTKGTGRLRDLAGSSAPETPPANTTVSSARKSADAIWFLPQRDGAPEADGYRRIERDARDVNVSDKGAGKKAGGQIEANKNLEEKALKKLTKTQRQQYDRLAAQTKDDPLARLALQLLLLEGKLAGSKKSSGKKDLLAELDALTSQKLADGIKRSDLIGDLVQELAVPSSIAQHNRGTCTVTSVQILAAKNDPAEFVRLVGGLASPKGEVKLRNGKKITREPGTASDDGTKRSVSSRLWQPAMMEYANGSDDYDNKTDKHKKTGKSGLNASQVDQVLDGLMGADAKVDSSIKSDKDKKNALKKMESELKAGKQVLAGIKWGIANKDGKIDGSHKVVVSKIGKDRVYYTNPWGKEESMSRAEFEKRLHNYNAVKM